MSKHSTTNKLTHDYLVSVLDYDPETGLFKWKKRFNNRIPTTLEAGCNAEGYIGIRIKGVRYHAHRLAWLFVYKKWPDGEIDHINRIRNDNRINNLRDVTSQINHHNRDLNRDVKGYGKKRNKWEARICVNYRRINIGIFATESEARAAYLAAKKVYHPTAPCIAN